jgi:hypothetical protein
MATPSSIGIEQADGSVKSIYCHWDGHIETNGKCLITHYEDRERAEKLIALGGISALCPELTTDFAHSFSNPADGVTIAYHRDRGEKLVIAEYKTVAQYFKQADYDYLYMLTQEGEWICRSSKFSNIVTVKDALQLLGIK